MSTRPGGMGPPAAGAAAGRAAGAPPSSKPPSNVGEVGRVLLSSTMLGYDSAVVGARKHMLQPQRTEPRLAAPEPLPMESSGAGKKKRNKKKNKKKAGDHGASGANGGVNNRINSSSAVTEKLQAEIRAETERFIALAAGHPEILSSHLERLRSENKMLSIGSWRDLMASDAPSEYDSDSTSTSTTANEGGSTVLDSPVHGGGHLSCRGPARYLQGVAQEKVLSQTREAISRAANLCEILADPRQPGSLERRSMLIRAFGAITTDHSTLPPPKVPGQIL